MRIKLYCLLIACFASLSGCQSLNTKMDDPQVQAGQELFLNGKGDFPSCASCHLSNATGDPILVAANLTGLSSDYILQQLDNFAAKVRIDDKMFAMNNISSFMTLEQRQQVAAYIGTLPIQKPVVDKALLTKYRYSIGDRKRGEQLYQQAQTPVGACASCHGKKGEGTEQGPRLRYQQYTYLAKAITAWHEKDPSTVNRSAVMAEATASLSAQDANDIAAFLAMD